MPAPGCACAALPGEARPGIPWSSPFRRRSVQICHKGPGPVGVHEEKRWDSRLFFAADSVSRRLCGRFGHPPVRTSPARPQEPHASHRPALMEDGQVGRGLGGHAPTPLRTDGGRTRPPRDESAGRLAGRARGRPRARPGPPLRGRWPAGQVRGAPQSSPSAISRAQ